MLIFDLSIGFVVSYIVIAVFVVLYSGWKIIKRTKVVPLKEIDLVTGRKYAPRPTTSEEPKEKVPWYAKPKRLVFS